MIRALAILLLSTVAAQAQPDVCNAVYYNALAFTRDKSFATRAADTCRLWAPLPSQPAFIGPYGPRVFIPPAPSLGGPSGNPVLPEGEVSGPSQPSPPDDALASAGNRQRGITRAEVEAAITDWCGSHADAPLCQKLRVR